MALTACWPLSTSQQPLQATHRQTRPHRRRSKHSKASQTRPAPQSAAHNTGRQQNSGSQHWTPTTQCLTTMDANNTAAQNNAAASETFDAEKMRFWSCWCTLIMLTGPPCAISDIWAPTSRFSCLWLQLHHLLLCLDRRVTSRRLQVLDVQAPVQAGEGDVESSRPDTHRQLRHLPLCAAAAPGRIVDWPRSPPSTAVINLCGVLVDEHG